MTVGVEKHEQASAERALELEDDAGDGLARYLFRRDDRLETRLFSDDARLRAQERVVGAMLREEPLAMVRQLLGDIAARGAAEDERHCCDRADEERADEDEHAEQERRAQPQRRTITRSLATSSRVPTPPSTAASSSARSCHQSSARASRAPAAAARQVSVRDSSAPSR